MKHNVFDETDGEDTTENMGNITNGNRAFIGTAVSFKGNEVSIDIGVKEDLDIIVIPSKELYLVDMPNDEKIIVEVFDNHTKCWRKTDMRLLCKGNIFRMYESDGSRKQDDQGNNVFVAASDAYKNSNGIWMVSTIY